MKLFVINVLVDVGLLYEGVKVFVMLCWLVLYVVGVLVGLVVICEECKGLCVGVLEKVVDGFLCGVGLFFID